MIALIITLTILLPGALDDDCGNGIPCGPIPWDVPGFPELASPTPIPTYYVAATATPEITPEQTDEPTPTDTPDPTATIELDVTSVYDGLETIESNIEATPEVISIDGDDVDFDQEAGELSDQGSVFVSYFLGLTNIHVGIFQPFLLLLVSSLSLVLGGKAVQMLLPVTAMLFGFIRKIISFILEFIPG
jgi:hypothetical protein